MCSCAKGEIGSSVQIVSTDLLVGCLKSCFSGAWLMLKGMVQACLAPNNIFVPFCWINFFCVILLFINM